MKGLKRVMGSIGMLEALLKQATSYSRKRSYFLLSLMLFSSIFELLSIYSIFPFIAIAMNPDKIMTHPVLYQAYSLGGFASITQFIAFIGVLIISTIIIGNAIASYTVVKVSQFCFDCSHDLSLILLKNELNQEYETYIDTNSNEMTKNILDEVNRFCTGYLIPVLFGLVKLVTIFMILSMLMLINPQISLLLGILFGAMYVTVYSRLRRRLARWGQGWSNTNAERFKAVGESLRGYKEIQISGNTEHFLSRFSDASLRFNQNETRNIVTPSLVRYLLEGTSITGMLLVGIYLVSQQGDMITSIPLLAMFALSGLRLMPAMQQMFSSVTQARFNFTSVEVIADLIQRRQANAYTPQSVQNPQNCIELEDISYYYPNTQQRWVLKGIDLKIEINSTIGIMGKTGSGKTTLADIIMGFLPIQKGRFCVDGNPWSYEQIKGLHPSIGYVPQHLFLLDASIADNIAFGFEKSDIDMAHVEYCAKMAHLTEYIDGLPERYNTHVGDSGICLSGGQKQRIAIARALYKKPTIVVFDEATSALDSDTEDQVIKALAELKGQVTLIMIAHRISTLEKCDKVVYLDNGTIVSTGTLVEVLDSPQYRKANRLDATTAQ